ncbi:sensor histidine kinase [Priestia endophytica]|uniref:sensor histidine kinase n=1 Tax=Priestia endophytica TaxID=135735 RepID=UPI000DCA52C9|nr:HAMP domain-containing sensor histidine kinase [Priestia endophytica]RAS72687.1 two-component sensor histidine kinase [Priestia endophytica]
MKWKLTGRYLLSIVLVVILVVIINIVTLIGLFLIEINTGKTVFHGGEISAERFTRNFDRYITVANGNIDVTEKGKENLDQKNAWIQVVDENGREVYGYKLPKAVKKKYTPLETINRYKYKEEDILATVFAGGKSMNNREYSYFVGFSDPNINKYVFTFDIESILHNFKVGILTFLLIDSLIAFFIGYLFSKRLTSPLNSLIDGIKRLANKDYSVNYQPKGIYKDVFYNVNYLSIELTANEKERKKLDHMREEWLANISHDIKTPLASIQGYAEMMKNKEYYFSLDEMREYADIIERKALYMKEVMEDLNLTTRLKNKELMLNKKKVSIVAVLRNIVIDILNDARYANRHIEFEVEQEKVEVEVDEILIRRALHNLIYNAVVHNDENVRIMVRIEKKARPHIVIKDNGKGIKKEELDKIFDRYYRGTNTGELHKGSGLGMAIAKDVIKAHDGDIEMKSMVGMGTTINIYL